MDPRHFNALRARYVGAHGGEAQPPASWEDNREAIAQQFRFHNARYKAQQKKREEQAAKRAAAANKKGA
jgi:hypothetical protein